MTEIACAGLAQHLRLAVWWKARQVPVQSLVVLPGEEVDFFASAAAHLGMLCQVAVQRRGPTLLGADDDVVRRMPDGSLLQPHLVALETPLRPFDVLFTAWHRCPHGLRHGRSQSLLPEFIDVPQHAVKRLSLSAEAVLLRCRASIGAHFGRALRG